MQPRSFSSSDGIRACALRVDEGSPITSTDKVNIEHDSIWWYIKRIRHPEASTHISHVFVVYTVITNER